MKNRQGEEQQEPKTYDEALYLVGDNGRYQIFIVVILGLLNMVCCFHLIGFTYFLAVIPLLCDGEKCLGSVAECEQSTTIIIDPSYNHRTISTDLGLYCEQSSGIAFIQSSYFVGSFIGGLVVSQLADTCGRKNAFVGATLCALFGCTIFLFSRDMLTYSIANSIIGFGLNPAYSLGFVIVNEVYGKQYRARSITIIEIVFAASEIFAACFYYYFYDWKKIYIATVYIPIMFVLAGGILMFETPRYLYQQKEFQKLQDCLEFISIMNDGFNVSLASLSGQTQATQAQANRKSNFTDLIRYQSLFVPSIGFVLLTFSISLIYFGSQFALSILAQGDQMFFIAGFMGVVEVTAFTSVQCCVNYIRRIKTELINLTICQLACLCLVFMRSSESSAGSIWLLILVISLVVVVIILRFSNCWVISIRSIHSNEFYPTVIRSAGQGMTFTLGSLGSISAPFTITLGRLTNLSSFIFIGALSLLGSLSSTMLVETLNQPIQDEIEELRGDSNEFEKEPLVSPE